MKINLIGHLVKVGKTNPNKPKVKMGKMNITSFITMNYEQRTMNDEKNKPKQTQTKPTLKRDLEKIEGYYGWFTVILLMKLKNQCKLFGKKMRIVRHSFSDGGYGKTL